VSLTKRTSRHAAPSLPSRRRGKLVAQLFGHLGQAESGGIDDRAQVAVLHGAVPGRDQLGDPGGEVVGVGAVGDDPDLQLRWCVGGCLRRGVW
jgi:hypothetical protein